jgi:putative ABC transport system ATP-binding protein
MIKVENAKKYYKLGDETVKALDGVSLEIKEAETVAIVGPSGSGKTTLMHCIGGIDQLSEGSIFVNNDDLSKMKDRDLSFYRNRTVGFVFQTFNLQPNLTALENVELPLVFAGVNSKERKQKAKDSLTKVGLGDRLNHKPSELSGGQRQRVSIARAIVNTPSIILADEPTGNLDSVSGEKIISLLLELSKNENITLIIVTHDDRIAARAERVIHILDGHIQSDKRDGHKIKSKYLD